MASSDSDREYLNVVRGFKDRKGTFRESNVILISLTLAYFPLCFQLLIQKGENMHEAMCVAAIIRRVTERS
jgi:hypothetical protein